MITLADVKPWMLEPATDKQMEYIADLSRVVGVNCHKDITKLEARVYINHYSPIRDELVAEAIRENILTAKETNKKVYRHNRFRDTGNGWRVDND